MKSLVLAAVALSAACADSAGSYSVRTLPGGSVEVDASSLMLRTSEIGYRGQSRPASTALVDVRNPLSVPVEVELVGALRDGAGKAVGELHPDSLRIPAGGQRTFALVHHAGAVESAVAADAVVRRARIARFDEPVAVKDGNVYRDGNRVVVAANIENLVDREAYVIVIAGFYDGEGRIVKRPFTVLRLQPMATMPARFVGPAGSESGYIFVGDSRY